MNPDLSKKPPHFFCASGHQHVPAGILDGDLVADHRTPEVRNRQIIVARLKTKSRSSAIDRRAIGFGCYPRIPISLRSKWICVSKTWS